jgi:FAD/FMN-containing dehydrogenase
LTPPVLTDYLELSVGGTLSAGGIGGATHRHGLQVDNVMELEVLTPDGQVRTCTAGDDLFDLVRGGWGRHGIILGARIPLIPAHTHARRYVLRYPDLAQFLADQRLLLAGRHFDHLEGQAKPGWVYEIEAVSYYTPPAAPIDVPAGLSYERVESVADLTYFDFLNRVAEGEQFLRQIGDWDRPHPWADLFLPDTAADEFLTGLMAEMTIEDLGENGVFLIYPFDTTVATAPRPRLPETPTAFLVALLRTAADDAALARMLAINDDLRRRTLAVGGTVYQDWTGGTPWL